MKCVEVTPGERFLYMIETFFGLRRGAARARWRPRTGRTLALLSRDVPAALAHRAGVSDIAPSGSSAP